MNKTFTAEELADIEMQYRQAKDPEKQIRILADMYECTYKDIRLALGLECMAKRFTTEQKVAIVQDARANGNKAAREKYGISAPTLARWMREMEEAEAGLEGEAAAADDPEAKQTAAEPTPPEQAAPEAPHGTVLHPDMCGTAADFLRGTIQQAITHGNVIEGIDYLHDLLDFLRILENASCGASELVEVVR